MRALKAASLQRAPRAMWLGNDVSPSSFVDAAKDDAHLPSPSACSSGCGAALPLSGVACRGRTGRLVWGCKGPARSAGPDCSGSTRLEAGMLRTGWAAPTAPLEAGLRGGLCKQGKGEGTQPPASASLTPS